MEKIYIGDKNYWNRKFETRGEVKLNPEESLVDNVGYFKKGSVLDIACGDGRNSLYLLKNNFKVTGIDFSSKALERLEKFAKESSYIVKTREVDLTKKDPLEKLGIFDNILVNHYKLNRNILLDIENHIVEDGILFISGFGHKHRVDSKIRNKDLILKSDFKDIENKFKLIKYMEKEDERGLFVAYIFRREDRIKKANV